MPASRSDPGARVNAPLAVAATLLLAAGFHVAQNRLSLTGGGIAWAKSWWLGLAIAFWFVLPACLCFDRRLDAAARRPFVWLLGLMCARAPIEGWMLYVGHDWSPLYGIGHDMVCAAALVVTAWPRRLEETSAAAGPAAPAPAQTLWRAVVRRHAFVSALLFGPEIGYAAYLRAHFASAGAEPIYFVPDAAAHTILLAVTAGVDVLATLYLGWFLRMGWHGTTARASP